MADNALAGWHSRDETVRHRMPWFVFGNHRIDVTDKFVRLEMCCSLITVFGPGTGIHR